MSNIDLVIQKIIESLPQGVKIESMGIKFSSNSPSLPFYNYIDYKQPTLAIPTKRKEPEEEIEEEEEEIEEGIEEGIKEGIEEGIKGGIEEGIEVEEIQTKAHVPTVQTSTNGKSVPSKKQKKRANQANWKTYSTKSC